MRHKIFKWLSFTVAFSLLPFVFAAILAAGDKSRSKFSLYLLWPHGELLLVSAGVAAEAIGDVIDLPQKHRGAKLFCRWVCAFCIVIESVAYVAIQSPNHSYSPTAITGWSAGLFGITLASAFACKLLGGIK